MRAVLILSLALLGLAYVALAGGREWLSPGQVWAGLWNGDDFLVHALRLPRVLLAVGAGMALGLAGALMQGLTRNTLATPDVIGLVQGASLGHVLLLVAGGPPLWGAVTGAALALALVSLLARGQGALAFVLYGIGVGATAAAATTVVLQRAPDAQVAQAMLWLSGSLSRADLATAAMLWAALGLGLLAVIGFGRALSTLWLGDELMMALGVSPARLNLLVLVLVAALTGAAVLAVGPLGFLAFTAAPLARALTGAEPPTLLPAALMGACLLVLADLGARLLAPWVSLPTGLLMALIGAPYLIFFLMQDRRRMMR
jgi:iron complex transport system permease protein